MLINRGDDYLLIVNASRKHEDLAWLQKHIGHSCHIQMLPAMALVACRTAGRCCSAGHPSSRQHTQLHARRTLALSGAVGYLTRSGYTGEDGFEIALPASHMEAFARWALAQPQVLPAGLGARNTLRLEAGLCLYGADMDCSTTPSQAGLAWSIPKARRTGIARRWLHRRRCGAATTRRRHPSRQDPRRPACHGTCTCARQYCPAYP